MRLLAKCPVCKCVLELQMSDADKRIRCVVCKRLFRVPDIQTLRKSLDQLETAVSDVFVDEQGNLYG